MPNVVINGTTYPVPVQGTNPPWGDTLTNLLLALVSVVNSTTGPSDILLTSFNLANNQVSAAPITGLNFDTSQVRSAIISYSIDRSTSLSEVSECGQIYISYTSSTSSWELAQNNAGNSNIIFSINNAGQLLYRSNNMSGTGYSGKLKFYAKAFLQT